MKTLLCLAAILFVTPLQAAEKIPTWDEMTGLFGAPIESAPVQKFVTAYSLKKSAKGDSGNFTPDNQSYSISFEQSHVNCAILHVLWPKDYGEAHWQGYEGELPFGLKRLFVRKDVVALLGEPDTSEGNFWQVQEWELRITFSNTTGLIQEIYVWKKSKPAAKKTK